MIRLHEFITKIRNCKTIAEERAEYQKEMAAIRQSFTNTQENLRPRNVTKLLFINMSGQETNFGQMQCLKLITANSLIEKRIGYLGLTQLFHEKSELLMMATNRIRVDLQSNNSNIVGLALCVLSEICTVELSKELHNEVLKCIGNNSSYIKKKAILTAIKIVRKSPEYIPQFLLKVASCLEEKHHGVLLSSIAFMENALSIDENVVSDLVKCVPRIGRVYRMVVHETNSDFEIGGVQDPFLQVAILRFLRYLRRQTNTFQKDYAEILVLSHDNVCARVTGNLKNGANAVLFECFQCFMLLEASPQARELVSNVLAKFISVKDANSKYLSLFNLNLMSKYDLEIVKNHKNTIIECLNQNDILIRIMGLDLLYLISSPENVSSIIKELLNTLLSATDEEFISELALKVCLIVEKHSQSRRWHFDTILKVLILADQSVKEESAKSLVHLITSTTQLQNYALTKLFFSTSENPQNDTLCRITLYLIGELGQILPRINEIEISETNILDLVEQLLFRAGVLNDTVSYGLSCLLKLYEKFGDKTRIVKMIKSFEAHSDLEVQKRACEYGKLFESQWDQDRKREVCIPVPVFKASADAFRSIPIGDTQIELDMNSLKMPEKLNINYDEHISNEKGPEQLREIKVQSGNQNTQGFLDDPLGMNEPVKRGSPKKNTSNLMDDDDIFGSTTTNTQPVKNNNSIMDDPFGFDSDPTPPQNQVKNTVPVANNNDPFGLLDLNMGGSSQNVNQNQGGGMDFLGMGGPSQAPPPKQETNLMGDDFFGSGPSQPVQQPAQQQQNANSFKAYSNDQLEIRMDCSKESNDTTRITTTYHNKTQSVIENLSLQVAVLKHLKLTINPLNSTTLQPLSKGGVSQVMNIVNSAVGTKKIVMKVKLSYNINGQKLQFEQKIDNFPNGL